MSCIQPHVADALPSLEVQLQEASSHPGRSSSHSGWLPQVARPSSTAAGAGEDGRGGVVDGDVGGGPEAEAEAMEQIRIAVAELLRQLVALDWALVCRAHVACLLSQLLAARSGGQHLAPLLSLDGRQLNRRLSASFTFRQGRSPSDTTKGAGSGPGPRVAPARVSELQGELLQWCAALVWADRCVQGRRHWVCVYRPAPPRAAPPSPAPQAMYHIFPGPFPQTLTFSDCSV